jgi:hypothetical protein
MPNSQDRLNLWIDSFPYGEAKKELEELRSELVRVNARMVALQDLIQMYDRMRTSQPGTSPTDLLAEIEPAGQMTKLSLREALRTLMAEHPERDWTSDQLWGHLAQRGWVRSDQQGKANMFAMLSVMTQQGQIDRVARGVYHMKMSAPEVAQ